MNNACPACYCETHIEHLSVSFGGETILDDINLHLHCGELSAIVGPNGAGKSTLLKAILGEIPYSGRVRFLSHDGSHTLPRFGYVPQYVSFDIDSPISVLDIMSAAIAHVPFKFGSRRESLRTIEESLDRVSARHLLGKKVGELSGGEMQRVLLAVAMTPIPNILLLDEPVSAVDVQGLNQFYETVCGLRTKFDLSIIVISHDVQGIAAHADRMILLKRSIQAVGKPKEVLGDSRYQKLFGSELINIDLLSEEHIPESRTKHHGPMV